MKLGTILSSNTRRLPLLKIDFPVRVKAGTPEWVLSVLVSTFLTVPEEGARLVGSPFLKGSDVELLCGAGRSY